MYIFLTFAEGPTASNYDGQEKTKAQTLVIDKQLLLPLQ
jgi:hypothetical protein